MQRDGANLSIWQKPNEEFKSGAAALPQQVFDVVIVGGGITGITTALLLQQAGKQCLLVEAHNIGYGTTSGTTAHLNTFVDTTYDVIEKDFSAEKAKLVAEVTAEAINLIKHHVETYNINCGFAQLPGYVFSQTDKQADALEKIADASARAGLSVQRVETIPVNIPFKTAIEIGGQAQFHPTNYIIGLAKAFEQHGGIIVENCLVKSTDDNDETLIVRTSLGSVQAKQMVYATHIPIGINLLHMRCAPYRSYAIAVTLKDGNYPNALVYDMYSPYHYYRTQEIEGNKYLIAGGEDHKTGHEENTEACLMRLESYVREHFEVEQVAYKWSSQYYEPADGLPYIGKLPGSSGKTFVATGFSGNGMTYGTVAAIIFREMLAGVTSKYEDVFEPRRVKPIAGFSNFIKENVDVAKELISGWLTKEKIDELAALAPGEARVVSFEDNRVALYKDEQNNLHAVNPVCTHMKCIVSWNNTEQSWDCPCHGARYNCNGIVLTGPSTDGLKEVSLTALVKK